MFDLLRVSETWLTSNSVVDHLHIPGYHPIFRKDRQNMRDGGVALFASQCLNIKRRYDLVNVDLELLWTKIKIQNFSIVFGVCYRPPSNSIEYLFFLK